MWTEAYLSRIGYEGVVEPSVATLRALHERHMYAVPFENLDIHWKRPIVVETERFLEKVIGQRRGGFCYELNGAFAFLLRELGFDVEFLSGRVSVGDGTFGPPFDHMALLVRTQASDRSGMERWLVDVGFGDSFVHPLRLDERAEQHDPAGVFRILEGQEWQMQVLRGGEWATEYVFTLEPQPLAAYSPMCEHQQTSPQSSFTKRRLCTLATPDGRITLTDGKLIVTRHGEREETPVADEEWAEVLAARFGVERN